MYLINHKDIIIQVLMILIPQAYHAYNINKGKDTVMSQAIK